MNLYIEKTISSLNELEKNGLCFEQSQSGYWRLFIKSKSGRTAFISDDSACEDFYDKDTAEAIFLDLLNDDNTNVYNVVVIAAALDECWDAYDFNKTLADNAEAAYFYLLENAEPQYEWHCFRGSFDEGHISYGDYVCSGSFGIIEYLKYDEETNAYEVSDKFNANCIEIEETIYFGYDYNDKCYYAKHIAFVEEYEY